MAGEEHRFKSGQSGNPAGRPKGSRNVLTENFITALTKDFAEHGVAAIKRAREDDPAPYLRLDARLAPKELHLTRENTLDRFSDDEIADLLAAASRLAGAEAGGRTEKANGKGKPSRIH